MFAILGINLIAKVIPTPYQNLCGGSQQLFKFGPQFLAYFLEDKHYVYCSGAAQDEFLGPYCIYLEPVDFKLVPQAKKSYSMGK